MKRDNIACASPRAALWILAIGISATPACEGQMAVAKRVMNEMEPYFDHAEYGPETIPGAVLSEGEFLAVVHADRVGHLVADGVAGWPAIMRRAFAQLQ